MDISPARTGRSLADARRPATLGRCRSAAMIALHGGAFGAIFLAAFLVRYDGSVPPYFVGLAWEALVPAVGLKLAALVALGNHRGLWRHASFADMIALAGSATLGTLAILICGELGWGYARLPRSVLLIDWAGTILVVGAVRGSHRVFRECGATLLAARDQKRALIVGAGEEGEAVARQIRSQASLRMRVVGFLDEDPSTHGRTLAGVPVLGLPRDVRRHAQKCRAAIVLVPSSALSPAALRELVGDCAEVGVRVQVVPRYDALLAGTLTVQPREVDIHDLLCREPVELDDRAIGRSLRGRTVLVTGASGSIGSEVCRQVLAYRPSRLLVLDHSENGLFYLLRGLQEVAPDVEIVPCIASITDARRLRAVFARYRPEVVFHAAAHKHVPMMEANPGEAVKNNVFGTKKLVDEAIRAEVAAFVMISTDKAVNPTSVMGACKRLAEMYVQSRSARTSTRLVTVRFGNVLGSTGSVVPVFREQIRNGGPVTVTHPDMTRYFMTIPEAAQLVLQAGTLGRGGEIFVLDMGEPVRIVDLARDMIRLSGQEVDILFSGLRPGEKLYEELYDDREEALPTPHPKIFLARHRPCDADWLSRRLADLRDLLDAPARDVVRALADALPEYRPGEHHDPTPVPAEDCTLAIGA